MDSNIDGSLSQVEVFPFSKISVDVFLCSIQLHNKELLCIKLHHPQEMMDRKKRFPVLQGSHASAEGAEGDYRFRPLKWCTGVLVVLKTWEYH